MNTFVPRRRVAAPLGTEVLIAGGGLSGMTLAAALSSVEVECAVVDPAAGKSRKDARTTAIACGSRRIYEALGVWREVRAEAQPIRRIRVAEGDSPLFLHFEGDDLGEGPLGHIVPNETLRSALRAAVARAGVPVLGQAVETIEPGREGVRARLSGGRRVEARLVAGADGRNSRVRGLAGIGVRTRAYGQSAIVCEVEHEAPHRDTAVERFLPSGPFAVLPMKGRRSAIVWTEETEVAEALVTLSRARFTEELALRFGGVFGEPRLAGRPVLHPLALVLARRHVADRVALVGDAAHAIHPIAGQGFNLGLRGVALLTEMLADRVRLGLDPADAATLARFGRRRRIDVATMVAATDGLNRLFANRVAPLRALRTAGLGGVDRLPGLKRAFMRHAMGIASGPAGPLPRLVRGEAA